MCLVKHTIWHIRWSILSVILIIYVCLDLTNSCSTLKRRIDAVCIYTMGILCSLVSSQWHLQSVFVIKTVFPFLYFGCRIGAILHDIVCDSCDSLFHRYWHMLSKKTCVYIFITLLRKYCFLYPDKFLFIYKICIHVFPLFGDDKSGICSRIFARSFSSYISGVRSHQYLWSRQYFPSCTLVAW